MNENDLAYDGSNEPQKRELTARERDIIYGSYIVAFK